MFIHVGATARSAAAPSTGAQLGSPNIATAVNDSADLTGIGIQISNYLKEWVGTENQTVVYVDSLTVLLQLTDLNRTYRFLHVLSGRIKSVDGRAYYRLDSDAHDQQMISTIKELLDSIIELPRLSGRSQRDWVQSKVVPAGTKSGIQPPAIVLRQRSPLETAPSTSGLYSFDHLADSASEQMAQMRP